MSGDFDAELGQTVDMAFDDIALDHRPHVLGRTGVNDVAGEEFKGL